MMNTFKKQILVAAMCGIAGLAQAQAWPTKTITIVVPFPPGGTTDVLARAVSTKLSANLGQTVIVENKPGAGATLGAAQVAKANADGYTLLMGAVHHTIATSVYKGLTTVLKTSSPQVRPRLISWPMALTATVLRST